MRILIVEDEVDLASALKRALEEEGYACDVVHDGPSGLHAAEGCDYDLLVLDLMLPGLGGDEILRRLREHRRVPVLILTARDGLADKVRLLNDGADDYLTKPFQLAELLARVGALIRRSANDPRPRLQLGSIQVDLLAREVTRSGVRIELTPKEYALVEYLSMHRGEVVSRSTLYEHLYDDREDTLSNVVDVYVSNVRRKLGRGFVTTRRGEGYLVDD
ncbi:MAG: response regulator transcription factor [Planctomycetota bacterium]